MDLPLIGSHCSLSSCNELDLLPIRCQCDKTFCRLHISPETHQCTLNVPLPHPDAGPTTSEFPQCAMEHCSNNVISSVCCPQCRQSFCVQYVCTYSTPVSPMTSNSFAVTDILAHTYAIHQPPKPSPRTQLQGNCS